MNIFLCSMDDLPRVADFYDNITSYLAEHINYPKWRPNDYPGYDSTKQAIKEGNQYACEDNGEIVGAFIINEDPQGDYSAGEWSKALTDGEYLIIHTLAAAADKHRCGIGRAMVEYCIDYAARKGYRAIRLDVVPENTPARKLYERMNFKYAGTKDLARGIAGIPEFSLYELNL